MAKTNFSKVEEALTQGLEKITINKLFELADISAGKDTKKRLKIKKVRSRAISFLIFEVNRLRKNDSKLFKRLETTKKAVQELLSKEKELTDINWKKIQKFKKQIESYKKEYGDLHPFEPDEVIVEQERLKHINKRFNVNEKWLPLK